MRRQRGINDLRYLEAARREKRAARRQQAADRDSYHKNCLAEQLQALRGLLLAASANAAALDKQALATELTNIALRVADYSKEVSNGN